MNYIKHLTGFFERVILDKTLNPTHVSLYMALFQFWNCNRFRNPISINRDEVMRISKISSKATYHKCLKNLHALGYINYEPSFNPFRGSHVVMYNFADDLKPQPKTSSKNEPFSEPVAGQVVNKKSTSTETCSEQAVVPSINNINNSNTLKSINEQTQAEIPIDENLIFFKEKKEQPKEKKLRKKKKSLLESPTDTNSKSGDKLDSLISSAVVGPKREEVLHYFSQQKFPDLEAQKFFNFFSSIGWLVGGKTPMANWHAAAQNWMLNANTFFKPANPAPKNLSTTTNKNYAEPL